MSALAAMCAATVFACQPGQTSLAHGALLAVRTDAGVLCVVDMRTGATRWRLPPGVLGGHLLVHRDGPLLTWFDADTGARVGDAVLQARGSFALVGASEDGQTAVLARTETRSTTFVLVSTVREREVSKPGRWRFEALNGSRLTLSRTAPPWDATVESTPGRYRFALVLRRAGVAVQALDTRTGVTRTVALPGRGYTLVPDSEGARVWAVSLASGRVTFIDGAAGSVVSSFRFPPRPSAPYTVAALAPDGQHLAASDGNHVFVLTPGFLPIRQVAVHTSIALGWSPDMRTLWVLGERSRFSPLRPQVVR